MIMYFPKAGILVPDTIKLLYRECNPQVLELAIESFKMGMIVE